MTELQLAIRNIELTLFQAEKELAKLKIAPRDLEKPPSHKWKHGDVFRFSEESIMIYIHENPECENYNPQVFRLSNETATTAPVETYLKDAEFLFNIKEKL